LELTIGQQGVADVIAYLKAHSRAHLPERLL